MFGFTIFLFSIFLLANTALTDNTNDQPENHIPHHQNFVEEQHRADYRKAKNCLLQNDQPIPSQAFTLEKLCDNVRKFVHALEYTNVGNKCFVTDEEINYREDLLSRKQHFLENKCNEPPEIYYDDDQSPDQSQYPLKNHGRRPRPRPRPKPRPHRPPIPRPFPIPPYNYPRPRPPYPGPHPRPPYPGPHPRPPYPGPHPRPPYPGPHPRPPYPGPHPRPPYPPRPFPPGPHPRPRTFPHASENGPLNRLAHNTQHRLPALNQHRFLPHYRPHRLLPQHGQRFPHHRYPVEKYPDYTDEIVNPVDYQENQEYQPAENQDYRYRLVRPYPESDYQPILVSERRVPSNDGLNYLQITQDEPKYYQPQPYQTHQVNIACPVCPVCPKCPKLPKKEPKPRPPPCPTPKVEQQPEPQPTFVAPLEEPAEYTKPKSESCLEETDKGYVNCVQPTQADDNIKSQEEFVEYPPTPTNVRPESGYRSEVNYLPVNEARE